jgi:hypothetical protein
MNERMHAPPMAPAATQAALSPSHLAPIRMTKNDSSGSSTAMA